MVSSYFNCYLPPDLIARHPNWYTLGGFIVWKNIQFQNMKFVWREYLRNDTRIKQALKDPKQAVLLEVNYGQHWVVAVSKNLFGNDYTVIDPWTGSRCNAVATYHNITGAAYFSRI
jgi:hypothetical protein